MYSFVVAVGKNNEMGLNNHLPWHLPDDAKFFKELTQNHTIIMGRKTFESLPKILPYRQHIVLTRDKNYKIEDNRVTIVNTLDELLSITSEPQEYFVIGGSQIFDLMLPYTQRIYLTKVDKNFEADVYFNAMNEENWFIVKQWEGKMDESNKYPHTFYIYERKPNK